MEILDRGYSFFTLHNPDGNVAHVEPRCWRRASTARSSALCSVCPRRKSRISAWSVEQSPTPDEPVEYSFAHEKSQFWDTWASFYV